MSSTSRPQRRIYAKPATTTSILGDQYMLQLYQHHPRELATFAIATFSTNGSEWSKKQRKAMAEFHADAFQAMNLPQINALPMCARDYSILPSNTVMQGILANFSNVFFLGSLGHVKFEWNLEICSRSKVTGLYYFDLFANRHVVALHPGLCVPSDLWLDPYGPAPGPHILGVLLHECCHAFLETYCCGDHSDSCPKACEKDVQKDIGDTGHGTAWIQLATHVQAVAKRYLDKSIDLYIESAMDCEFASSARVPIADEVETALCHAESHGTLAQFRMLTDVSKR